MFVCAQQGCQSRESDGTEWSMGDFNSAKFSVDDTGSISLQFSNGDGNRYVYLWPTYLGICILIV